MELLDFMDLMGRGTHMMRIVSQPIPADNEAAVECGLVEAQCGLACTVTGQLPADASFAERSRRSWRRPMRCTGARWDSFPTISLSSTV